LALAAKLFLALLGFIGTYSAGDEKTASSAEASAEQRLLANLSNDSPRKVCNR
jgi:hypothetical protein